MNLWEWLVIVGLVALAGFFCVAVHSDIEKARLECKAKHGEFVATNEGTHFCLAKGTVLP